MKKRSPYPKRRSNNVIPYRRPRHAARIYRKVIGVVFGSVVCAGLTTVAALVAFPGLAPEFSLTEAMKHVSVFRGGTAPSQGSKPTIISAAKPANGAILVDQVTRVRDGDTIVVGLIPIRIANLDCAERNTIAGDRATARMKSLAGGQTLTCQLEGRRSYDREVGVCALATGRDIGEIVIAEGLCAQWR